MADDRVVPVLLSGGAGSRLWPLSREALPKQLLALTPGGTLLQRAALRAGDPERFAPPIVVANHEHRFLIAEQLREAGVEGGAILLEAEGRNTAPAAAVAALRALEGAGPRADPLLLVMPADHVVANEAAFGAAVEAGAPAARAGRLVLFGIAPTHPATGYGWVEPGVPLEAPGVRGVAAFREKPDAAAAARYLAAGHLWNSGVFLLPARVLLAELERLAPGVLAGARAALRGAVRDLDFLRLDPAALVATPSISLDHAVMERTDRAAVVALDCGWSDVGSWSALHDLGEGDEAGNRLVGEAVAQGSSGCYVRSEGPPGGRGPLVAVVGARDLVVVATPDAVLVVPRARDQEVKGLVERLKREGRAQASANPRVHRPWGYYEGLHRGERFQVKRITVKPGAKLSLQRHFHRAEHWVVVNGTALVTHGPLAPPGEAEGGRAGALQERLVFENESIYLPIGTVHRLANPGRVELNLIEVQSGAYLGEDDIVRIEDDYARAG